MQSGEWKYPTLELKNNVKALAADIEAYKKMYPTLEPQITMVQQNLSQLYQGIVNAEDQSVQDFNKSLDEKRNFNELPGI